MTFINGKTKAGLAAAGILAIVSMSCVPASATTSITHRWTFDEYSSNPYAVDTGNPGGIDAQTFGDPIMTSEVPSAVLGDTQSFNSNGDGYFTITGLSGDDFTACAWIKTSASGSGINHWEGEAILHSEVGGWGMDYGFGVNEDGNLMFGTGGMNENDQEGSDFTMFGGTTVNDDVWHNVCVSRNATTGVANLWVDGRNDGTGNLGRGTLTESPTVEIGAGQDGGTNFIGFIDDVRFYDSELSATEINNIHNGNVVQRNYGLANTGQDQTWNFTFGSLLIALGITLTRIRRSN